jgi:hypothetical protein
MTPSDDDLARSLRDRADAVLPPMSVDVGAVVRSGRRRRVARGASVLAVTALAVTGTWSGVQPIDRGGDRTQLLAATSSPAPTADPDDLHARVDPVAGTITFPMARYDLTADELATVTRARAWEMKVCAEAAVGRPIAWEVGVPGVPVSDRLFGVWSLSEAQQYGYDMPPTGGSSGGAVDPDVDLAVWDACNESETVRALSPEVAGSQELADALSRADEQAEASEASRSAVADWTACLARNGLEPAGGDRGPSVAGSTTSRWDEASIALAVIDVQCKTEVDFVPRMADARAAAMAPVLVQFRDELESRRAFQQEVVARAEAYLAAHPEIP